MEEKKYFGSVTIYLDEECSKKISQKAEMVEKQNVKFNLSSYIQNLIKSNSN